MTEYFVVAASFAAPFVSDMSYMHIFGETPKDAMLKFVEAYTHPRGLYSAQLYPSADDYHKEKKPLARWVSNHELAMNKLREENPHCGLMAHAPGKFQVDDKLFEVDNPKGGELFLTDVGELYLNPPAETERDLQVKVLSSALQFYANTDNYRLVAKDEESRKKIKSELGDDCIELDQGIRARLALAVLGKQKPETPNTKFENAVHFGVEVDVARGYFEKNDLEMAELYLRNALDRINATRYPRPQKITMSTLEPKEEP